MRTNLKRPCNDCPFRRSAKPGWLGASAPEWFLTSALTDYALYQGGTKFAPCHQTVDYDDPRWREKLDEAEACVGALQFCANNHKVPRDPDRAEAVKKAGRNPDVFERPDEFIRYHEDAPVRSWEDSTSRKPKLTR